MATAKSITIKAALDAIQAANTKYESWSNGWWLIDSGVEGLMVANIAEALGKIQENDESLVMELPFDSIREWSGFRRSVGRPPRALSGRNRADIVLLNNQERPVYVFEAKRTWYASTCQKDLERLRDLVRKYSRGNGGSLKSGFLATMLVSKATSHYTADEKVRQKMRLMKDWLRDKFDTKQQRIRCHIGPTRQYPQELREALEEVEWSSAAVCIEVSST